jgi:nitroreductase
MDALECINSRRSVRKYKSKKIPSMIIKKLIAAGANAPSAFNDQSWVFITITEKSIKENIVAVKSQKSKFLKDAPLLIACCYDSKKSRTSHDVENVSLAAENILLAAHALGLGAGYITAYDSNFSEINETISKELKLPKNVKVVCLLSIGYPNEKPAKKIMRPLKEIWSKEKYGCFGMH